jgi:hypothetical protein
VEEITPSLNAVEYPGTATKDILVNYTNFVSTPDILSHSEENYVDFDIFFGIVANPQHQTNPSTYEEAIKSSGWAAAIQQEKNSIMANKTWTYCNLPSGVSPITAKWIFKTKYGPDAKPIKLKAHLVARGFLQREGIDFDEVFAPVAKWNSIRLVIAMAASEGWDLLHLDVKTTFLYGELNEPVYMRIPLGFITPDNNNQVCLLCKSFYGLRQSPRMWFQKIDAFLFKVGMSRTEADYTLYYMRDDGGITLLILYVDDLLLTGSNRSKLQWLKVQLQSMFEMSNLGNLHLYLGVEAVHLPKGLFLTQCSYVHTILEEFDMLQCNPATIPLPKGLSLGDELQFDPVDKQFFQRLIGKLIYLTNTHPNIQYAVNKLSRHMHNPRAPHLKAAKQIL